MLILFIVIDHSIPFNDRQKALACPALPLIQSQIRPIWPFSTPKNMLFLIIVVFSGNWRYSNQLAGRDLLSSFPSTSLQSHWAYLPLAWSFIKWQTVDSSQTDRHSWQDWNIPWNSLTVGQAAGDWIHALEIRNSFLFPHPFHILSLGLLEGVQANLTYQ